MTDLKIETMALLSEGEIRAGIRCFCEARDQHVEEGRHALAGVYAALAAAFKAEQLRRERMFKEHRREMVDTEASWNWDDGPN